MQVELRGGALCEERARAARTAMWGRCLRVCSLAETVQYPPTACVRVVSFIHRFGEFIACPPRPAHLRARPLEGAIPFIW